MSGPVLVGCLTCSAVKMHKVNAFCGCVRINVAERDKCGTVTDDVLHHVWVVVICIGFIHFVIRVRQL